MRDGTLSLLQTIDTGGGGSGFQRQGIDSLGSQGGLILDKAHHHLFAVNTETLQEDPTGDNHDCQMGTISSFLVGSDGTLTLADKVSSGGLFPDSLAVDGDQLYVLNAGGPGTTPACGVGPNITGFTCRHQWASDCDRGVHAAHRSRNVAWQSPETATRVAFRVLSLIAVKTRRHSRARRPKSDSPPTAIL